MIKTQVFIFSWSCERSFQSPAPFCAQSWYCSPSQVAFVVAQCERLGTIWWNKWPKKRLPDLALSPAHCLKTPKPLHTPGQQSWSTVGYDPLVWKQRVIQTSVVFPIRGRKEVCRWGEAAAASGVSMKAAHLLTPCWVNSTPARVCMFSHWPAELLHTAGPLVWTNKTQRNEHMTVFTFTCRAVTAHSHHPTRNAPWTTSTTFAVFSNRITYRSRIVNNTESVLSKVRKLSFYHK